MTEELNISPVAEDAVEALALALDDVANAPFDKRFAISLIDGLKERGFTITRAETAPFQYGIRHNAVEDYLYDEKGLRPAPLPDVELTMEAVTYHAGTVIAEEVRDIIAAQAEKIAMLEHDLRLNLIARDVAFKSCAKLEAENKRLREALNMVSDTRNQQTDDHTIRAMREIARAALAQTDEPAKS